MIAFGERFIFFLFLFFLFIIIFFFVNLRVSSMTKEVRALRIIEALERSAARLNDVTGCVRKEERRGKREG